MPKHLCHLLSTLKIKFMMSKTQSLDKQTKELNDLLIKAGQGDAKAQSMLGRMYAAAKNYKEALKWCRSKSIQRDWLLDRERDAHVCGTSGYEQPSEPSPPSGEPKPQ